MDFLHPDIQAYCDQHSDAEPKVLAALNRDTFANVMQPRMLSGHFQGRVLSMISHLIKPKRILEIGTYTGYSAICLAEGLADHGELITIDVNPEQEDRIRKAIADAGMESKIRFIVGDAFNIIKSLPGEFDLIFIDADKENYRRYYDQVIDRMPPGGVIIADNVLWSGKVVTELTQSKDKTTAIIHEFNEYVSRDQRVEKVMLPIRDGLFLIRKK